jgi:hypothetical protein
MSDVDTPAATVRPVEEDEATGKVAEIFADIKRTKNIDFAPRFWQVIATNPVQLELVWASLKSLVRPEAGTVQCRAFPGDNRGEAPTTCSLRLLNGLAFDFRLQGGPSAG